MPERRDIPILDPDDLSGIVHDLRGPVRGVRLYAGLLEREPTNPEFIAAIAQRAERLDRMLLAMHELGEATARVGVLHRTPLHDVVQACIARSQIEPRFDVRARIFGDAIVDPVALATVIDAILENVALHHDRPEGRLEILSEPRSDGLVIRFIDDGPGINPHMLKRVGRPFQTTKADAGHLGMGLANARIVLHAMGGRLEVTSPEPRGACVSIVLPVSAQTVR